MATSSERQIRINVPPEYQAGTFADFARLWHTDETFVLDFATMTGPPKQEHSETRGTSIAIDAEVVSRVRIPASQAWELMRALEKQLSAWEKQRGKSGH